MQEGFFQIPFPHLPSAASSYSTLARYKTKNWKSESPPHSLLTAVLALVSVHIFLSGIECIQKNYTRKCIEIHSPLLCHCLGSGWKCRMGPLQQSFSYQFRSNDFQGSDSLQMLNIVCLDTDRALYIK